MRNIALSCLTLACLAVAAVPTDSPKQPIYMYLYARITDHVNLGITEDRIHRVVASVDKYRRLHPDAHVSATLLFSGAASDALAHQNAKTHIVDFVKGYVKRGTIEVGYDGTDEPTYAARPTVDFTEGAQDPEGRWLARRAVEEKFLREGRDPLTGAPQPGKAGGLKRMQEVFGEADCITGINTLMKIGGNDALLRPTTHARVLDQGPKPVKLPPGLMPEIGDETEAVEIIRSFNSKAIMFGIPDTNPAQVPGFRGGRAGFGRLISPLPETAPELYWQDNVLRSSDAGGDEVRLVHASAGAEPLEKLVQKVDRNKIHVVHIELAEERSYLQPEFVKSPEFPALEYAYDHRQSPELPADALLPKSDVDAAFAKEDALLAWVTGKFLPADPGSRCVSSRDLARMVAPSTGFSVSMDGLRTSLAAFLKSWGTDTFAPPLFEADGHYLSRAELFQVMVDALAEQHRTGKLPASIKVVPIYGPVRVLTGHGPNAGEVSVGDLARICAEIAPSLHDQSPGPVPKNSVPIGIPVAGAMLNPAQFVKLMANAILHPSPETKLAIRMSYVFIGVGQLLPRTRPDTDDGFIWTIKPAQINAKLTKPATM